MSGYSKENRATHSGTTSEVDEDVHVDGRIPRLSVREACREQDGDNRQTWRRADLVRGPAALERRHQSHRGARV